MKKIILTLSFVFAVVMASFAQGQIKFTSDSHDFGKVKEDGGPVTYVFEFENTGNAPVVISNVRASCGCTTPNWTKEPVLPGKKGSITAQYNPLGRPGVFNKTLTVTANTSPTTTILKIRGEVSPKAAPTPGN